MVLIEAVVFDAYGTLFDVDSVAEACDRIFPGYGKQINRIWRRKQLEYAWLRALMGQYEDFAHVNRDALRYALNRFDVWYDDRTLESILATYYRLPPFADVARALQVFKPRTLSILSNGTPRMLEDVVRNAGLQREFNYVLSADRVGTYKPDPNVYEFAVKELGLARERILFVSSNGWDVAGSKAFGFTVGWINREGKTLEELDEKPDYEVTSLTALADALSV